MRCDQCQAANINGVFAHEAGCPNGKKTWQEERQAWVRYVDCFDCGYPVEVGEVCDCRIDPGTRCGLFLVGRLRLPGGGQIAMYFTHWMSLGNSRYRVFGVDQDRNGFFVDLRISYSFERSYWFVERIEGGNAAPAQYDEIREQAPAFVCG